MCTQILTSDYNVRNYTSYRVISRNNIFRYRKVNLLLKFDSLLVKMFAQTISL